MSQGRLGLGQRVAMGAALGVAAALTRALRVEVALKAASWLDGVSARPASATLSLASWEREARSASARWAALGVPVNCLDQALAMRWVTGCVGYRAQVVIGFTWRAGAWRGHAWLEGEDGQRALWRAQDRYKEVLREPS